MTPGEGGASGADSKVLLDVKDLTKHFPIRRGILQKVIGHVRAVDGVTFHLDEGETLSLVGESGCGKTTTARCILRAIDPTSGTILYRAGSGEVIDVGSVPKGRMRPLRAEMQMVFQDPFASLNPRMTLLDIVGEPLLVQQVARGRELRGRVRELLEACGLRPEYEDRFPHEFSGGQRQRISLARALALSPQLVIADEPVSSLDVSVQAQILNLMIDLQRRLGLSYLFIAHDLSVVRYVSDRIAVMYLGRIVESGRAEEVFRNPRHPYTEALLSAFPTPDPTAESARIALRGDVPSSARPPPGCHFHTRCPYAEARCSEEVPNLAAVEDGHESACLRVKELVLQGRGVVKPPWARGDQSRGGGTE